MVKELKANVNGKVVGSQDYFNYLNDKHLKGIMPRQGDSSFQYFDCYNDIIRNFSKNKKYADITKKYSLTAKSVKNSAKQIFQPIAAAIVKDINDASEQNNFMRYSNGQNIQKALNKLKSCGITGLDSTIKKVDTLSWYIDLDNAKVKRLQNLLIELGYGPLIADGIYSEVTDNAWGRFMRDLEYGDLIQVNLVEAEKLVDNANVLVEMSNQLNQTAMASILIDRGKTVTTKEVEKLLLEGIKSSEMIKIGQRKILVWGIALDILEIGDAIRKNLKTFDNMMTKKTFTKMLSKEFKWLVFLIGSSIGDKILIKLVPLGAEGVLVGAILCFAVVVTFTAVGEDIGEWLGEHLPE